MRRAALAIITTIAGLVGLLSFKTESLGTGTSSALSTPNGQSLAPAAPTPSSSATKKVASGSGAGTKKKSSASSSAAAAPKTVTGSVVETQFGPVQVKVTVANGKVTAAAAVQYPNGDPRSAQINEYAIPILEKETVGISSASSVDMVSGATYTSDGYLQSLQSALDQVGP